MTYVGRFAGGRQRSAASDKKTKQNKKKTLQYFKSKHLGAWIEPAEERPGQDARSVCRDLKTQSTAEVPPSKASDL